MLKELFGNTSRARIIFYLFRYAEHGQTMEQIAAKLHLSRRFLLRELQALRRLGLVRSVEVPDQEHVHWQLDPEFPLTQELRSLVLKEQFVVQNAMTQELRALRGVKLLLLTGFFVENHQAQTDVLVVGKIKKTTLLGILKKFRRKFNKPVHYTILSEEEYNYRMDLTDRFLYTILGDRHIRVIDKLEKQKK